MAAILLGLLYFSILFTYQHKQAKMIAFVQSAEDVGDAILPAVM